MEAINRDLLHLCPLHHEYLLTKWRGCEDQRAYAELFEMMMLVAKDSIVKTLEYVGWEEDYNAVIDEICCDAVSYALEKYDFERKDRRKISSLVYLNANRKTIQYIRSRIVDLKRQRAIKRYFRELDCNNYDPETIIANRRKLELIIRLLSDNSKGNQRLLKTSDGTTLKEIARDEGVNHQAIAMSVERARKRLQNYLDSNLST